MAVSFRDSLDPDDIDDFVLDWTNRLTSGETISTFTATVAGGVATVSGSTTGTTTTARISAATAGTLQVRYRIVTSAARQLDETATIQVEPR